MLGEAKYAKIQSAWTINKNLPIKIWEVDIRMEIDKQVSNK